MTTLTTRLTASQAAAQILSRLLPARRTTSPIDQFVSDPWNFDVNFKPARGEFGHGKATVDIFGRLVKTTRASHPAKYNDYCPNAEEARAIRGLAAEGHTALGIALILADRDGELVPVHEIEKIL
jgi:hypothetical protein